MNSGLFRSMFSVEFEKKRRRVTEEEERMIYTAKEMKEMTLR